jgi:hypothetical protein
MPLFRPRCVVHLYVPNIGTAQERTQQEELNDVYLIEARAHSVRLEVNHLNEADECDLQINYDDAGIDPRFLRSAEVWVYIGDAGDADDIEPGESNLRFVGIVVEVERTLGEKGRDVHIRALDYTTLFLTAKTYPPSGYPKFTQTLRQAWETVCDNTGWVDFEDEQFTKPHIVSTVQRLKKKLVFLPEKDAAQLEGLVIGNAVGERLKKLGSLQLGTAPGSVDAWAVWQTAVGSLGLVSFIRGPRCIVTTATDYYTSDNPPRFIWGKNILDIRETRDLHALSGKNVGIISFNPVTGQVVEAFWPPLSMAKGKGGRSKKGLGASALTDPFKVKANDYECFDCPMPITDPAVLERFARRVWEERSRQELVGELTTRDMLVEQAGFTTAPGATWATTPIMDILALQSGDRIRVEIDREVLSQVQRLGSISTRVAALEARGYSAEMAQYMANNADGLAKVTPEFQVRNVSISLETTTPPGNFEVKIKFVNRIDVSGSSEPGEGGESMPLVEKQAQKGRGPGKV